MISLLITIAIILLVIYLLQTLGGAFRLVYPWNVVAIILVILVLLGWLGHGRFY